MARVVPIEVSSPEGFGTDRRVGTPHPSARLPVRAPTVVDINTYQLKTAKGFWSRFLLVVLVPLGLTLTWLTLPTQDSALLYFMARLALQVRAPRRASPNKENPIRSKRAGSGRYPRHAVIPPVAAAGAGLRHLWSQSRHLLGLLRQVTHSNAAWCLSRAQGCVVGLVVVTFINHASPIKEVGHVPVSSQCAVVAGYGILAPVGTFIGVCESPRRVLRAPAAVRLSQIPPNNATAHAADTPDWWGSLSPDAVYLGIIAAHLVMWPAATVGLPRTFVASEVDDSLHIVSDSSISYGGSDGEADATAQGRGPISVQNTASTAYDSADWAESVVPNLVVRAVTLRIGWALLILAFQLRFCSALLLTRKAEYPD